MILRRPAHKYEICDHALARASVFGVGLTEKTPLIYMGSVQKSGCKIYFCPDNKDFAVFHTRGDDKESMVEHFPSYREAYKSQDW